MTSIVDHTNLSNSKPSAPSTIRYRHTLVMRITHWVSVVSLFILLLSGFQIFNAHPALYWGQQSHFDRPLLKLDSRANPDGNLVGITSIGNYEFNTTGFLGASKDSSGDLHARGFPSWLTIPGPQWLAMGRRWHFFFAWTLVVAGFIYVVHSFYTGHFSRDLWPERADWRGIGRSIIDHALLRHPKGEAAARYNVLQRLSYLAVIFILVPLMVITGLAMSPRMDTVLNWFLTLVGGRQSARTLHFVVTFALVAFVIVHLFEVLITGALNNLRSIISGRFHVDPEQEARHVSG